MSGGMRQDAFLKGSIPVRELEMKMTIDQPVMYCTKQNVLFLVSLIWHIVSVSGNTSATL